MTKNKVAIWFSIIFLCFSYNSFAQITTNSTNSNHRSASNFWQKVRFGGGIGAQFGSNFTDVSISPSALYEINPYIGIGMGLHGGYIHQKRTQETFMYGGSVITLINPIPEIQLSAEFEQLRVNTEFESDVTNNFWNSALFLGAGYRSDNVTIGARFNILHENNTLYSRNWMPFIRVYF